MPSEPTSYLIFPSFGYATCSSNLSNHSFIFSIESIPASTYSCISVALMLPSSFFSPSSVRSTNLKSNPKDIKNFFARVMSQEITPALNSLEEVITSPARPHQKDRDAAIHAELEKLQKINGAIEQSRISIQESTNYIKRIKESTVKANELIHIWSKILSQNKHTAELLADPQNVWQGASHEDEKVQEKMAEYEELAARYEQLVEEKKSDEKRRARRK
ncbi:hypothetical protein KL930_003951 [Ogataea haglerorum]|uniref:DASH complex subunit DUO1 n=1 Tax=Ogataea haglerorum TaxID=1937702 RepID=A0ABQ7RD50_9ASCO|nr:uncharacterized protein KL911_004090 [Ogataea haglerorum]KAG7694631.1 hypothetical protein KL915_003598 [Ogataea haglerorum]KAG7705033.1 hypothetical protein KL914_003719 [Ogataea haglerorum]KAG7716841.1 hypothetical protein KL913_003357 [Ogataea haglerorum]KAG7717408.1 hypothetical protein KL949_003242 [Ogataea haglerorum]KAG7729653.1 hypothetical protein KL948_003807 [Ogataea haglerorum]